MFKKGDVVRKKNGESFSSGSEKEIIESVDGYKVWLTTGTWIEADQLVPDNPSLKDAYLILQEASGIEVGDTVRVLRKASYGEMGWENGWVSYMDGFIGLRPIVDRISNVGIRCKLGEDVAYFPFFVLEIVKKASKLPEPIKISSQYSCEFKEYGSIKVGCQSLDFEMIEKIYNTAKEVKG